MYTLCIRYTLDPNLSAVSALDHDLKLVGDAGIEPATS